MGKKQDELLKALIEALQPVIRKTVEEILAEKLREDPRLQEAIRTGAASGRLTFKDRSITKMATNGIQRKVFNGTVSVKSGDEGKKLLSAVVSTAERDRDGEVVLPEGINYQRYRANPVLCWQHDWKIPPIGKCVEIGVDKRGLNCKFQFSDGPFASEIFDLYRGGYLRAFSIGFAPVDFDRETKTHRAIELLEVSSCAIPANPQALVSAIGKGLVIGSALRKDLGLKDEIFISDLTPADVKGSRARAREVIAGRLHNLRTELDRIATDAELKLVDIIIEDGPEKSEEELIDEYVRSGGFKKDVNEAVEVALAKIRGRVI